jgi:phage nucleotide-binding protein
MGVLDAIRPVSEKKSQHLSLLVYGAPGSGKTWLAGSAADAGVSTLVLDAESGTMTIRDSNADVLTIDSMRTLRESYREIKAAIDAGTFAYDLVVLDSLTEIQKLHIDELSQGGTKPLAIKQWGEVIDSTRRTVRAFRDLPCHVLVLALSKEVSDDGGGGDTIIRVRPSVHGSSLPHELGGFFDVVGYAGISEGKHMIAFAGSERVMAKDRSRTLSTVEPNDFGVIYHKVFGSEQG